MRVAMRGLLTHWRIHYAAYRYIVANNHSFVAMTAAPQMILRFAYSDGARVERTNAALVSASYFTTLGLPPQLGRLSFGSDRDDDARPSVVLADSLWAATRGKPVDRRPDDSARSNTGHCRRIRDRRDSRASDPGTDCGEPGDRLHCRCDRGGLANTPASLINAGTPAGRPGEAFSRRALVFVDLAITTAVVAVSAQLFETVRNLATAQTGVDVNHLFSVDMELGRNGYTTTTGPVMYRRLRDQLAQIAEVETVTLAVAPPLGDPHVRRAHPPIAGDAARCSVVGWHLRRDHACVGAIWNHRIDLHVRERAPAGVRCAAGAGRIARARSTPGASPGRCRCGCRYCGRRQRRNRRVDIPPFAALRSGDA